MFNNRQKSRQRSASLWLQPGINEEKNGNFITFLKIQADLDLLKISEFERNTRKFVRRSSSLASFQLLEELSVEGRSQGDLITSFTPSTSNPTTSSALLGRKSIHYLKILIIIELFLDDDGISNLKTNEEHGLMPVEVQQRQYSSSLVSDNRILTFQRQHSERVQEQKLARISCFIVWFFLFCHVWKLIPTAFEAGSSEDGLFHQDWPTWVLIMENLSHLFITINSTVNFLIYVIM